MMMMMMIGCRELYTCCRRGRASFRKLKTSFSPDILEEHPALVLRFVQAGNWWLDGVIDAQSGAGDAEFPSQQIQAAGTVLPFGKRAIGVRKPEIGGKRKTSLLQNIY